MSEDIRQRLVRICDPEHPHYPEHGKLTGEIISVLGQPMAKLQISGCIHGTDACFVSKGQIELLPEPSRRAAPEAPK